MPATTREQAAAALFNVVSVAVGNVVSLKTGARRVKLPEDVSPPQTPALYQVQMKESYEYTGGGLRMPPKRTLHFDFYLYTSDAAYTINGVTQLPSTQLNAIVQAVETAMAPDPTTGSFTLGGIVASCRLQGEIEYLETRKLDGMSIAILPIAVLIP